MIDGAKLIDPNRYVYRLQDGSIVEAQETEVNDEQEILRLIDTGCVNQVDEFDGRFIVGWQELLSFPPFNSAFFAALTEG